MGGLGGGGTGGAIVSGILSMVVFSFAVLSGPLIAAMISFETSPGGSELRQRATNNGIAHGIGFIIFGFVIFAILALGLTLLLSDGGASGGAGSGGAGDGGESGGTQTPVGFVTFIGLVAIMAVPNGLVGGGITYFLGPRDDQTAR